METAGKEITVAVVEDDDAFRESLALLVHGSPGLRCVSRHADGAAALAGLPADRPEVVLLDIQLPKLDGIALLRRLKPDLPAAQFIMLTSYSDDERIFESLQAGASGYLLKRSAPAEILQAITEVHRGGSPMSSYIARRVVQSFAAARPPTPGAAALSPREAEIVGLLAQGYLYKEIADQLAISLDTVRTHLRRTYEKLQVRSRTGAVMKYLGH